MKRILSLCIFILILSCAHSQVSTDQQKQKENFPRQSFIFFSESIVLKVCGIISDLKVCLPLSLEKNGSGFIFLQKQNSSLVVTAEHVCKDETKELENYFSDEKTSSRNNVLHIISTLLLSGFNFPEKEIKQIDLLQELIEKGKELTSSVILDLKKYIDLENKKYYNGKVLKVDSEKDLCVVEVPNLKKPNLKLAKNPPLEGDTVYTVGAPAGFRSKNLVPIFMGFYIGDMEIKINEGEKKRKSSFYSLFVTNGSSGSMIINNKKELIGVVTNTISNSEVPVGIGPTFSMLKEFLKDVR